MSLDCRRQTDLYHILSCGDERELDLSWVIVC